MVHGNLKLQNLFFGETGEIKLLDLNFWIKSDLSVREKILNEYSAPEIFTAQENKSRQFTEKSDIWSLGVIILNLYLGYSPWTDVHKNKISLQKISSLFKRKKMFPIP
jgi:mitogen-activated protein kinase kinase